MTLADMYRLYYRKSRNLTKTGIKKQKETLGHKVNYLGASLGVLYPLAVPIKQI